MEQIFHSLSNLLKLLASKEFQIDQYLIISRAPAMYLFSNISQLTSQHQLYL